MPLEPYVWIKTGVQLVVRVPGTGEEVLGKPSGSLKGTHDSRNTGIQRSKEPAETSPERPSEKCGETIDTCCLRLPD